MNDDHLLDLLEKYRTGQLSDEDRAELERTLLSSADAREAFWRHARFHSLMTRWGQESWGRRLAEGGDSIESAAGEDRSAAVPASLRIRPAMPWRMRIGWFAAAAALVLVALLVVRDQFWATKPVVSVEQPTTAPAGVAVLASVVDARWADAGPSVGAVLEPGLLRLSAGVAQIEFYSGARVILQGPAELELKSPMEAFCRSGRLSAFVPGPARGFKVGAARLSVIDLGTEFGLYVPPAGAPEVHVFTGIVEVTADDQHKPVKLSAGEAMQVEHAAMRPIPADHHGFISDTELERLSSAEVRRREAAWESAASLLSQDPATIAHYTFGQGAVDRTIANRAVASPAASSSASVVGCRWSAGRWPGHEAVDFGSRGDRVRFDLPLQSSAITLLAWVRVDGVTSALTSLLTPDGLADGTVRWELGHAGELRLAIARQSGRPTPNWEVVESPPAVKPELLGRWVLLVSTFDGTTVRHYVDGQEVKAGRALSPSPLQIGQAEIGNWRGDTPRNFKGRMDEFAVLSRAMTAAEIQALYDAGRSDGR